MTRLPFDRPPGRAGLNRLQRSHEPWTSLGELERFPLLTAFCRSSTRPSRPASSFTPLAGAFSTRQNLRFGEIANRFTSPDASRKRPAQARLTTVSLSFKPSWSVEGFNGEARAITREPHGEEGSHARDRPPTSGNDSLRDGPSTALRSGCARFVLCWFPCLFGSWVRERTLARSPGIARRLAPFLVSQFNLEGGS